MLICDFCHKYVSLGDPLGNANQDSRVGVWSSFCRNDNTSMIYDGHATTRASSSLLPSTTPVATTNVPWDCGSDPPGRPPKLDSWVARRKTGQMSWGTPHHVPQPALVTTNDKLHANRSTAAATNITALFARITPLFSGKEEVQQKR
jgi:hypothetical protein